MLLSRYALTRRKAENIGAHSVSVAAVTSFAPGLFFRLTIIKLTFTSSGGGELEIAINSIARCLIIATLKDLTIASSPFFFFP
jgi:hypothetical protein